MDYTNMSWKELEKLMYGKGANFDKIAFDRLGSGKGTAKKLRQAFTTSFKKGESFDQLIERIRNVTGAEAVAAKRIARTETTRIESIAKDEAAHEYQKETGETVMKIWFCSFHNSRESHMDLHMQTVRLDDDFKAAGGPMKYPGDGSRVGPEEVINCQCWMEISRNIVADKSQDEMNRALKTHQYIGEDGREIIPEPLYNKLIKPVVRAGGIVRRGDEETELHLSKNRAGAATINNVLLFRKDATKSEVLEEVYHFKQNKRGDYKEYSAVEQAILKEIDAQKYLIRSAKRYKIPIEETELTKRQLAMYKRLLKDWRGSK